MSPQDLLQKAAREGNIEGIRRALSSGANPKFQDSRTLQLAAKNGHIECVRELISISDTKALDSLALYLSAERGHGECARELLPVSDAGAARANLAEDGHPEAVALLDAITEEEALKAKHLKPTEERAKAGL